jgi:hypothetical protein
MSVGASTCIVLSVAALKNRGKITGVVRPLVQRHHYSKLLGVQDASMPFLQVCGKYALFSAENTLMLDSKSRNCRKIAITLIDPCPQSERSASR